MMNKSEIEYCDFTWNPVTGCYHGCQYCYAAAIARRFAGNTRINKGSPQIIGKRGQCGSKIWELPQPFIGETGKILPFPAGFEPTYQPYRLSQVKEKKKPAVIFVVSMGDLFGEWVPDEWIINVLEAAKEAPQHLYLFLTKNPKRYSELHDILPEGDNFWYGTTVTDPDMPYFASCRLHTWISIEPIQRSFSMIDTSWYTGVDWIVIGAENRPGKDKVIPEPEWIYNITRACHRYNVPVFMKSNIYQKDGRKCPEERYCEYPDEIARIKNPDVPVKHRKKETDGKGHI